MHILKEDHVFKVRECNLITSNNNTLTKTIYIGF